jgi:proteasome lid subunit RPN8/RPN11
MPFRLLLPRSVSDELIALARKEQPNECCGLLAGVLEEHSHIGRVERNYPLVNAQASPVRYEADSHELLRVYRDIDERHLELLAVYHSHPTSQAIPSATDHSLWGHGPEVMCLIVSLVDDPPSMRGWWLEEGREHREAEWQVV